MTKDFLLEIGSEELPAKQLNALTQALLAGICEGLTQAKLSFSAANAFSTPRRLAIQILQLQEQQADQPLERKGPPVNAAYDSAGKPTKALQGFLHSCGLNDATSLQRHETAKGTWFVYRAVQKGALASALLPAIIALAIKQLPIAKSMRWGAGSIEFIRPVHWVVLLFGEEPLAAELLGIKASNITYGHRFMAPCAIALTDVRSYAQVLEEEGKVMVEAEKRQDVIKQQCQQLAQNVQGNAVIDSALLEEVANLVEWPVPLLAEFSRNFLQVPKEVLIAAMQGHQKCFPVCDDEENLLPYFITVSNIESRNPARVREGNEKVMAARLADAKFFYEADRKQSLKDRLPALEAVLFEKTLGTLRDKSKRISQLAGQIAEELNKIAEKLKADELRVDRKTAEEAGLWCKADLVSEMVGEFPELQGIMGGYYVTKDSEPIIQDSKLEGLACAIRDHYQPKFAGDQLPSTNTSCVVALADKLDTLVGIFGVGQLPTGSKDPFALRRAGMGIVRILVEKELPLDIKGLIEWTLAIYEQKVALPNRKATAVEVENFIIERLQSWYRDQGVSMGVFSAVQGTSHYVHISELTDFDARVRAVIEFMKLPEAKALSEATKRVSNILKQANKIYPDKNYYGDLIPKMDAGLSYDKEIRAEKALYDKLIDIHQGDRYAKLLSEKNYSALLSEFATLKEMIENFFNDVRVMVENKDVRDNRLRILKFFRNLFLSVADISLLVNQYHLIILDRDGVINEDSADYIKSADEWLPIPGSLAAIAKLNASGYKVCVCSNQSGIGRGYFTLADLDRMHAKMQELLAKEKGHLDAIFFCPHAPAAGCNCRKPKPALYQQAMAQFKVSPQQTLVIGDALRDIQAAKAVGCDAVLVLTGKGQQTLAACEGVEGIAHWADLQTVVKQCL